MARYENTKKQRKNNKDYYSTTVYKKVNEKNSDGYFIATEGDRCDNLAQRFYGDSSLWWFIARTNNLTTNNIPAGTSIRIPANTQDAEGF
jgi:nucleoid-associated protein YgaU|tara:strand:- start:3680 stop:3949 length:270 start_codon:yes stop_codon:yes gene_type:complete